MLFIFWYSLFSFYKFSSLYNKYITYLWWIFVFFVIIMCYNNVFFSIYFLHILFYFLSTQFHLCMAMSFQHHGHTDSRIKDMRINGIPLNWTNQWTGTQISILLQSVIVAHAFKNSIKGYWRMRGKMALLRILLNIPLGKWLYTDFFGGKWGFNNSWQTIRKRHIDTNLNV